MRPAHVGWIFMLAVVAALVACNRSAESSEPAHTVAPAPQAEPAPPQPAEDKPLPTGLEPPAGDEPAQAPAAEPAAAEPAPTAKAPIASKPVAKNEPATPSNVTTPKPAPTPVPQAKTDPPTTEPPSPPEPPKAPPPEPATPKHTKVASTKHVRVEVGAGMQKLLDADPRMEPWIASVIGVADKCYADIRAKNASAEGAIKVRVTMHKNERPTPDVRSLPSQLSSMVVCATGKLMSKRMPLFTGPEGEKHDLTLHFTP